MNEQIINIIDEEIQKLEQIIATIDIFSLSNKKESYINKINDINSSNLSLAYDSVEEYINYIKEFIGPEINISEEDLNNLCFYIDIKNDYELDETQKHDLNRIINLIITEFKNIIDNIEQEINKYNKIKNEIERYNTLKEKLANNTYNDEDLDTITSLFKRKLENKKSNEVKEYLKIYIDFIQSKLLRLTSDENIEEIPIEEFEEIEETNLNEEQLKDLLNKYSIDFNLLNKKSKEKLLAYGNLEKISNILKVLRSEIGISPTKIYELSEKFATILVSSTEEIVSKIISNYKEVGGTDTDLFYESYIRLSGIFVKGNIKYQRKNNSTKTTSSKKTTSTKNDNSEYTHGSYESYENNRKLLLDNGINDINKLILKCGSFFQ